MLASSLMHKNNHKHELGLRNADIGKLLNVELSKSPFALALQRASKQLVVLDRILCSKSVFRGVSATGNNSREEATSGVAFLFSTFVGLSQLLTNCHHQHGSALGQGIWKFHGGLGVLTSCLASVKESTSPVSNPSTSSTLLCVFDGTFWISAAQYSTCFPGWPLLPGSRCQRFYGRIRSRTSRSSKQK